MENENLFEDYIIKLIESGNLPQLLIERKKYIEKYGTKDYLWKKHEIEFKKCMKAKKSIIAAKMSAIAWEILNEIWKWEKKNPGKKNEELWKKYEKASENYEKCYANELKNNQESYHKFYWLERIDEIIKNCQEDGIKINTQKNGGCVEWKEFNELLNWNKIKGE